MQFIKKAFEDLNWTVTLDEFDAPTPYGTKRFTNVVATLNPNAKRRLMLAAHYDSKYMRDKYFLGATDSAMPCAMLIEIARIVTPFFKAQEQQKGNVHADEDEVWNSVQLSFYTLTWIFKFSTLLSLHFL